MNRTTSVVTLAIVFGLGVALLVRTAVGQEPSPSGSAAESEAAADMAAYPAAQEQTAGAERKEIWNSPRMLRARAWLQEYVERSARISPEEAEQYMAELERLTPMQMKLWLLKFDEEQQQLDQQRAAFQQTRRASVAQAMDVNQATTDAYRRISQGNREAIYAQEQFEVQRRAAQEMYEQRTRSSAAAAREMIFDGPVDYGYPAYPAYRNFHYHVHGR